MFGIWSIGCLMFGSQGVWSLVVSVFGIWLSGAWYLVVSILSSQSVWYLVVRMFDVWFSGCLVVNVFGIWSSRSSVFGRKGVC